jgi:hypothetical protein
MKQIAMKQRKDKPIPVRPPKERQIDAAFDLWLQKGLHKLFDEVAQEPVPEELLRLIEEDRDK